MVKLRSLFIPFRSSSTLTLCEPIGLAPPALNTRHKVLPFDLFLLETDDLILSSHSYIFDREFFLRAALCLIEPSIWLAFTNAGTKTQFCTQWIFF